MKLTQIECEVFLKLSLKLSFSNKTVFCLKHRNSVGFFFWFFTFDRKHTENLRQNVLFDATLHLDQKKKISERMAPKSTSGTPVL